MLRTLVATHLIFGTVVALVLGVPALRSGDTPRVLLSVGVLVMTFVWWRALLLVAGVLRRFREAQASAAPAALPPLDVWEPDPDAERAALADGARFRERQRAGTSGASATRPERSGPA